jgi:hypothetical protein
MKLTLRDLHLNSFAVQRRQREQKPVDCNNIPHCCIVKIVCRGPRPEESSQRVEQLHVNETVEEIVSIPPSDISLRLWRMNSLLSNAIPAAFGERDAVGSHFLQLIGICVSPASWFEDARIGEDGGVVVHPVCGHGNWRLMREGGQFCLRYKSCLARNRDRSSLLWVQSSHRLLHRRVGTPGGFGSFLRLPF